MKRGINPILVDGGGVNIKNSKTEDNRLNIFLGLSFVLVVYLIAVFFKAKYLESFNYFSSIVGAVGFPLTLIGLWWAYQSLDETKYAARQAEDAAREAKGAAEEAIRKFRLVTRVINLQTLDELLASMRFLHRSENWEAAIEKYDKAKAIIVDLRATEINSEKVISLNNCLNEFTNIESEVEFYVNDKSRAPKPDPAKVNIVISSQLEIIRQILAESKVEVGNNG